ncbi:MAG: DUF1573 domain-containing protein [Verrucomicrobiota bacterium]
MRTAIICVLTAILASNAWASLNFKATTVERAAKEGDETVAGKFEFTNIGKKPIAITKIDSSCRCLGAKADKQVYQPGESGTIEAAFEIEGLAGKVEKTLTVVTNHPETPYVRLAVIVDIPLMMSIEPKMLDWAIGEDPKPKPIVLKVLRKDPVHVTNIQVSRKNFSGELKTIKEGREYHIELKPTSTESTMLGVVTIETDCEVAAQKRQLGFFRIQPPGLDDEEEE